MLTSRRMAEQVNKWYETLPWLSWGLVNGKTQTIYPWASPAGSSEPELRFHDIFRGDGTPYLSTEVDFIRNITGWKR